MHNTISKEIKYFQVLLCILFFNFSFGHSTHFTLDLNVTPINETCPGNGRLDFFVNNTTAGGTIIYTVYKFPNLTTPIVTTQANTFTGLVAANYRVVATESLLNGEVNTQQVDVVILDQIIPLRLNFISTNQNCIQTGSITVETITGQPVLYEIITGPNAPVSQSTNIFTNLTSGNYQIKITDNCGSFITQNITIDYVNPNLVFSGNTTNVEDCNMLNVKNNITPSTGQIMYPITVLYTVYDPNANSTTSSNVITSGDPNFMSLSQLITFYHGLSYYYTITVSDSCGNVFTSQNFMLQPIMEVTSEVGIANCNDDTVKINVNEYGLPPFTASFLSAPPGFVPSVFNNQHPNFNSSPFIYYNSATPLPIGNYEVKITDACGRFNTTTFTIDGGQPQLPTLIVSQLKGCSEGYSSINIGLNTLSDRIVAAALESAPASYTSTLPVNLNAFIYNGQIFMSNLTSGNYKFKITDSCGNIRETTVSVIGYHTISNNFTVNNECSSFGLLLENNSNILSSIATFWLQKYDSITNQWVHPLTGNSLSSGISTLNAIQVSNNSLTNIANTVGRFRIVKSFYTYKLPTLSDLSSLNICFEQLGEFEFYFEPKIKDIYSFSCGNNLYQVIVDVVGVAPFRYEIIEKDGAPFYIDNVNSSIFNAIAPGVYKFKVTDSCGNEKLRLFEVSGNVILTIAATPFCNGSIASLSVPYFPYLHYEWWKDNNTSTIISNSNFLQFNTFNLTTDFGTYHVKITNPGNPNTCINFVDDYVILGTLSNPNAGIDVSQTLCGTNVINLETLLDSNHDPNGVWTEISNSGVPIINGTWNATNISPGIYNFKYIVNGLCGLFDEAIVVLQINQMPQTPIASFNPIVCDSGVLQLYATSIPGATYVWNGPNGFNSTVQNPTIANLSDSNSGVYNVIAIKDGCPSGSNSVVVEVKKAPNFSIGTACFNGVKQLFIEPTENAIVQSYSNYVWIFPDGSTHTGNPITISNGDVGIYSVEVQNTDGCTSLKELTVKCTTCGYIPKGVSANGDFKNDTFDLQCLEDVKNVKIYNRYGVLLFDKDYYLNEWNGYDKNGNLLPPATYYYLITFNSGESKTGWVYLNY